MLFKTLQSYNFEIYNKNGIWIKILNIKDEWTKVKFYDKNNFKIDDTDSFQYYWDDLYLESNLLKRAHVFFI